MKSISIFPPFPDINALLELAGVEAVVLKTAEGREFVLAEVDSFEQEVSLARQNTELMEYLYNRSSETQTVTLREAREQLGL